MKWRTSDRVAQALLFTSMLGLLLLQVVPFSYEAGGVAGGRLMGYEIWREIADELIDFRNLDAAGAMISVALIFGAIMVLCSPFLIGIVRGNRAIWWFFALCSGMVFIGLTGLFAWMLTTDPPDPSDWEKGPGLDLLMIFPAFHFAGVLCIRRRDATGDLAPPPEAG